MIEVNGSDTDFKGWKFPHSSMIPENYIFIDNTLDDAINNTENTSGTSAGNSFKIQQTLKICRTVQHHLMNHQQRGHSYKMKLTNFQHLND